jgi:hypothetical protein
MEYVQACSSIFSLHVCVRRAHNKSACQLSRIVYLPASKHPAVSDGVK